MVDIVLCSDENYAPYAAVVMASALANAKAPTEFRFFVLTLGMPEPVKNKLQQLVSTAGATLHVIEAETTALNKVETHRFGQATLLRLFMNEYLPADCQRVIYLDCDVLVLGDLADLWSVSLNGYAVGAVMDLSGSSETGLDELKSSENYFNAGVLLVDLKEWRNQRIGERAVDCLCQEGKVYRYLDQDALNVVLSGEWLQLDIAWNVQPVAYSAVEKNYSHLVDYIPALEAAIKHPKVVHFIGAIKPWHGLCVHPLQDLFLACSQKTPWPMTQRSVRSELSWSQRLRLANKRGKIRRRRKLTQL